MTLYLFIARHGKPPVGSLSNIHELYDENPNPFVWIKAEIEREQRKKNELSAVNSSNLRNITITNNVMSGSGACTLVETDGAIEGLTITGNSVEGYDEVTLINSKGDLRDVNISDNKIRSERSGL